METDILTLDGKLRRLEGKPKVRVDLSRLTLTELEHLRSGVESAIFQRQAGREEGRCWIVPAQAVEVFVVRKD